MPLRLGGRSSISFARLTRAIRACSGASSRGGPSTLAAPVSSGRRGDAASAGHGTAGGSVGTCGSLLAEAPEEDVIGAPMLAACWDAEADRRVRRRAVALGLRPEHFQRPSLGFLFSVLVDLAEAGEPVDPVAVAHEAERRALANVSRGRRRGCTDAQSAFGSARARHGRGRGDRASRRARDRRGTESREGRGVTLDEARAVFRSWLHLPDTGPLDVVLAASPRTGSTATPSGSLLVGPPGRRQERDPQRRLRPRDTHPPATLTEASLLSGTPKREKAAEAKGGLLREIGDCGIIVCKDFGSVLST